MKQNTIEGLMKKNLLCYNTQVLVGSRKRKKRLFKQTYFYVFNNDNEKQKDVVSYKEFGLTKDNAHQLQLNEYNECHIKRNVYLKFPQLIYELDSLLFP